MNGANHFILKISNLRTYFYIDGGVAKAVDGVDLELEEGGTLGVVGESGCGKSVTALSIMRLIPDPPGKIVQGEILFHQNNLLTLEETEMRKIRGKFISMIFQEPMTSLNPVFQIGEQISEALRLHEGLSRKDAWERSIEMLREDSVPGTADQRISAPAEWRNAPTGDDRHGPGLQPQNHDCR